MNIRSLHGDDQINSAMTSAMYATLLALEHEGAISAEYMEEFANTHVCLLMAPTGVRGFFARFFGKDATMDRAMIFKACQEREPVIDNQP